MQPTDQPHADSLRNALLKLTPSGAGGFEDLLAIVLTKLTGQTFCLAKSGTQRGRDGDSAFDQGATYFEGKRYDGKISTSDVASKIIELGADNAGQVDLWVLGVTSEVGTQVRETIIDGCQRIGIGVYILDWSDTDIGALIIAIAAAGSNAKDFISTQLSATNHSHLTADALEAIDYFAAHADFKIRLQALKKGLSTMAVGLGHAKAENEKWLRKIFESRQLARCEFGQLLAPLDSQSVKMRERAIDNELQKAFTGQPTSEPYAVTGDEGAGKSWLTVAAWLRCKQRPILVFCTADELLKFPIASTFEDLLIQKLIRQTGGHETEATKIRWQRRLLMWKRNPQPDNLRLTLVADGLNQSPCNKWAHRIDEMAVRLTELGGSLVFTTRTGHWLELKSALISKVKHISVSNWTPDELSELLRAHGINPDLVKSKVLEALKSPRIASIAIGLFAAKDIERIEELSVERLMFEHMRKANLSGAASLSEHEFAKVLQDLAQQTLERVQKQQLDDLNIFCADQSNKLKEVASCQFFTPVPREAGMIEFKTAGLNLGLALWLISALERGRLKSRQPRDQLATLLEPVSALDEMANVALHAAQVACIDDTVSIEVRAAIIEYFVLMQNIHIVDEQVFTALPKYSPDAFLLAAENIYTRSAHVPNENWILWSLLVCRDHENVWDSIRAKVKEWLSYYSLAPERMMFANMPDTQEKIAAEREECTQKIKDKVSCLTEQEKTFWETELVASHSSTYDRLHYFTFCLLAGKPLAEFAPHFIRRSFANALSPSLHSPREEFHQLVRFNAVDWRETRNALLECIKAFEGEKASGVGAWASVNILSATGDTEDASKAKILADWLTRDRKPFPRGSLLEKYCASDPCDPCATKPDNVDVTAEQYRTISPSGLAASLNQTREDHFFDMARAGVARFRIDDALVAHNALAENVLHRSALGKRLGVFELQPHTAAIDNKIARKYLTAGLAAATTPQGSRAQHDKWLAAQYSVILALPHLTANEQLDAIERLDTDTLLINLLTSLSPADAGNVEAALIRVATSENAKAQIRVLGAIQYSNPELTPQSVKIIAQLTRSPEALVRSQALGICATAKDRSALQQIVDDGWSAKRICGETQRFECQNGSRARLEAAKLGILPIPEALDRMQIEHYGFAALELGTEAAKEISQRFEEALKNTKGTLELPELPIIEMRSPEAADHSPSLISLNEPQQEENLRAQLERASESDEEFEARQTRMEAQYNSFTQSHYSSGASFLLANLTLQGIFAIFSSAPSVGAQQVAQLLAASESQLRLLHHTAIQVGIWGAVHGLPEGEQLLRKVLKLEPIITYVEGMAKLPSEASSLWCYANNATCKKICHERLLTANTDKDISLEVLAACKNNQEQTIAHIIEELWASDEPAKMYRAVTIAGFCDAAPRFNELLNSVAKVNGYMGIAAKAAKWAYDRNCWARHWYTEMRSATSPVEFWRASVLFAKLVDARFELWSKSSPSTKVFDAFWHSVSTVVKQRIAKWHEKRKNKLFGHKKPDDIFLGFF